MEALKGEFLRHSERLAIARREKWEAAVRKEAEDDEGKEEAKEGKE